MSKEIISPEDMPYTGPRYRGRRVSHDDLEDIASDEYERGCAEESDDE